MNGAEPKTDDEAKKARRPSLRIDVAAWGLALYSGARAIEIVLAAQSMAAAVGQAVLAEWGASRLGVTWSDPSTSPTTAALVRRGLVGAAIGIGTAALVLALLLATRALVIEPVPKIEASILGLGLLTAALQAWRDELIQHGVMLRALRDTSVSSAARVIACGATSAGAALGRSDATARTVFVATLLGVVFGALWVKDRGAWQPWAAHTAVRWTLGTLVSGGIIQARLADNAWSGASAGFLGGTAAAVALAPAAVLAVVWTARRRISPSHAARVG